MEAARSPYIKHLYVCVNRRDPGVTCCSHGGGEAIKERIKAFVKANGLKGKVRVSSSGCMDLCAQGPNVMVTPDHLWYHGVTLEDVDRIIEEQLAPLVNQGQSPSGTVPSPHSHIRAFLLDLGNVLIQFDHMQAARTITANAKATPEELYRMFFESPLIVQHDEGRITTRDFYEELKRMIGFTLSYGAFLAVWNDIFTENQEMTAFVRRLLSQYPCFLISNTNRPHFEFCRKRFSILNEMNGWILSYEVGALKPKPIIYQRALEMLRIAPSQVFYIDDRTDLIEAGQRIGFQTHRFTGVEPLVEELKQRGVGGLPRLG